MVTACGGIGSPVSPGGQTPPPDELIVVTATPGNAATTPIATTGQRYVVREGDTVSALAARFGVAEAALLRANAIDDPDSLQVGQALLIPPPEP